ncbi:hypothetical protein BKA83DRAFT_1528262 [Pisolithus microcarpus]|nr:hypothetical protein BKA83DRAFT_1528262 [Pisolithus microcarpus]
MKHSKIPKQVVKEASKRPRREKLDPTNHKSNVERQNEAAPNSQTLKKRRRENAILPHLYTCHPRSLKMGVRMKGMTP